MHLKLAHLAFCWLFFVKSKLNYIYILWKIVVLKSSTQVIEEEEEEEEEEEAKDVHKQL